MVIWENVLKENEYFSGIPESDISHLLEYAVERTFSDKEIIFSEGARKEFIFVLGRGTVLISKVTEQGNESVINILTKKEIFPHTGLFDSQPYPGTAVAKKDVLVLMIPFHAFERFVKENPQLSFRIIQ
ncbi:MAG: cyclic nucleotide-binding domain-containing protein [Bacillaceae bacterium]|nr:cyclic nucleotide-binding domain-containing protein [Bacillaceae bacterium]